MVLRLLNHIVTNHKQTMVKHLGVLFLLISLLSCEKDIEIELDDSTVSLVVDASIENGKPPVVILSKSFNYFAQIDPSILSKSFVRNAAVYVSDGIKRTKLREDSITSQGTSLYFYTNDPAAPQSWIIGNTNTAYTLDITADGREYRASTTIPAFNRQIDSLWWESPKGPLQPEDSNRVLLMLRGTDKPGLGSYVRYFTKVNNEPFLPGLNSVFDDQVIDGTTYTVTVDRGLDKNADFKPENLYFNRGDTVVFKLADIDKKTYDFWRTLEFSFQSVGNPFSSPVKVLGNVSGGALGCFAGYAAQFRQIIIPKR